MGSGDRPLTVQGSSGQVSEASLRGGVVHRDPGPWSAAVLALLRHLEQAGFAGAPRVVGGGLAADGREMVSDIDGSNPHRQAWDEDAIGEVGALVASLHAAAAIRSGAGCGLEAVVRPGPARFAAGVRALRYRAVEYRGQARRPGRADRFRVHGPVDAIWDLAQAAWLNAQLHDDDIERCGLLNAAAKARQLRLILDG